MNTSRLKNFDLTYPGYVIDGSDRDSAFQTAHVLYLAESQFVRAVTSFALFEPVNNIREYLEKNQSKYERCVNNIYAEAFVYSLNAIRMLLKKIESLFNPPDEARKFIAEYESHFGQLVYIRDSAMHIEDRGRGVDKKQKEIKSGFLMLGAIDGNHFTFTGEDGKDYKIEISEATLLTAHKILQSIINSYDWRKAG